MELHGASTYHSIVTWSDSALWAFIRTEGQVSVCILQLSRKLIKSSSEALSPSRQCRVSNEAIEILVGSRARTATCAGRSSNIAQVSKRGPKDHFSVKEG